MGTNFYASHKHCNKCKRYDLIHIGKSSAGWTFGFHATDEIRSYKDWIKFLSKKDVKIFSEYEVEISLFEFKEMVKVKRLEPNCHAKQYPDHSFLDEESNGFSEGEFS